MLLLFSHPVVSNFLQLRWRSLSGCLVLHNDPEFAKIHVHYISDAIQPSHRLMASSPSALNPSQHQRLFQWVICSHQMTKILKLQLQSFLWIFGVDLPQHWLVWSPCCSRDFQESSLAPQLEGINSLAFCLLYGPALTKVRDHWEDHSLDYMDVCRQSSAFQHVI